MMTNLVSCNLYNSLILQSSACFSDEDCRAFKDSLVNWKLEMKKSHDYKELTSYKGLDKNNNGLRDDIELYIDNFLPEIKNRHWMPKTALKTYGAILAYYSTVEPSNINLKGFREDYNRHLACMSVVLNAEGLVDMDRNYIYGKIRFLVLKDNYQRKLIDNVFLRKSGQPPSLTLTELAIHSDINCNVSFSKMANYKKKIFLRGGRNSKRNLVIELIHFEKKYGKKFRSKYEEFL